ncbi:GET complex subunit get1 [Orbilia oligospora]|uniref:GET complex subunit get1 n=1 Tax=Orbilia oligospora TaxID=2813651 RepID=A0A7C8N2P9_ORBOL|nr:GET complex subunit get1 [Orbilia oligospora]KAF3084787.1 GET complex subunit get1 [Orbilia oligospora]KAF3093654.1 GET complex subunit get1 [Orbilia oligospora]KAF3123818.1 GET complex subunit get1 [Orbilia oligospora]KAF3125331.1 GET complex subunit get1 [Orbilia oligospora]
MSHLLITSLLLAIGWQVTSIFVSLTPAVWETYTRIIPTRASADAKKLRQQQAEILRIRKEMTTISSQDEFAKWAKLRREHDRRAAESEKLSEIVDTHKMRFSQAISTTRWLLFSGLGFFIQFWYRREPVFWLPNGWIPDYVEWGLCFPQAPRGSVSVNVWGACTAAVAALVSTWLGPSRLTNNRGI